ncbi:MAG: hypothetical protein HC884_08805 [Chloroflexaceae bacterium]|nr:hypothetical protein [Chloroflexaceae bacterium]
MKEYTNWQVERFRQAVETFVRQMLNGEAADDVEHAIINRAGKLGHLQAMLKTMAGQLDIARQGIENARITRQRNANRGDMEKQRTRSYDEMKKRADRQGAYLAACQSLLTLDRWDIAARTASEAATAMHEYVARMQESLDAWVKALATDAQGVFATVLRRQRSIQSDRHSVDALHQVRHVVNDQDYENRRYQYYVTGSGDMVAEVLKDLVWEVSRDQLRDPKTRELRPFLNIGLKIRKVQAGDTTQQDLSLAPEPVSSNADRLLHRCRQIFKAARETESISAYLMDKYDGTTPQTSPEALAEEIFRKNEPLLQHGGANISQNYLCVYKDRTLERQEQFLNRILRELAGQSNVTQARAAQIVDSVDRFRLTFIYHHDVIELEQVHAYQEARVKYGDLPSERRQLHHVFAAERNIVPYEKRLSKILSHRIVLLLEDPDLFNLAVLSWLYRRSEEPATLLNEYSYDDEHGQRRTVWRLTVKPEAGEFDTMGAIKPTEHYFLTNPENPPSLVDALETFSVGKKAQWYQVAIEGSDVQSAPNAQQGWAIPYEQVRNNLRWSQEDDCTMRVEQERLGKDAVEFQGKLQATRKASEANLPAVQLLVAQFEKIKETIEQHLDPTIKSLANEPHTLDYSLYLLIREHLKLRQEQLRRDINRYG